MAMDYYREHEEEEYIDMEITSYTTFLCHSPGEFEFQMSSSSRDREFSTTSPADELFYKGKLLPLHLPPRLQMVEKLFEHSTSIKPNCNFEELYATPLATTTTATPFESCNISPSESCQLSRELDPDEYFRQEVNPSDEKAFISENNAKKHSWTRKLKLIRQSSFGSKLKASGAYLKSLFGKSGCSDESSAKNRDEGSSSKAKVEYLKKGNRKVPFGQIRPVSTTETINKEEETKGSRSSHRRSFSGAFKRRSMAKLSSSSSSSGSSSSSNDIQVLKRSSSAKLETESPIQGAIAHCKQSQQSFRSTKTSTEVGLIHSLSASTFSVRDELTRPEEHCRG
ncbi:hypothetical protein Ancab_023457 [Ancistrocladus abbreviatus]